MPNQKLIKQLDEWGIDYELLKHKTVYTAHDVAATLKKKLDEIAKTLIVQADKDFYFIAVSADKNLDFAKLKKAIKKAGGTVKKISIPSEKVLASKLKIKPGKITGFGSVHKLPSLVDKDLTKKKKVIFSAGDVKESVLMTVKDYLKVEEPAVEIIGAKRKVKKIKSVSSRRSRGAKSVPKKKKKPTAKKKKKFSTKSSKKINSKNKKAEKRRK